MLDRARKVSSRGPRLLPRQAAHNGLVYEQGGPQPHNPRGRVLRELAIYAYSSVLVLYALACGWVLFSTLSGELSRTASVFGIIGLGLIAPVCTLSMRQALRLQTQQSARQEPGIFSLISWRPGLLLLRRWTPRALRRGTSDQGIRAPLSRHRAFDIGIAVASAALFWAFWAGSLSAALVVPITVHWMRRPRD
ncbi:hypothetical protein BH23ACT6_BH23ACT6_22350 [soil metagenome]